MPAPITTSTPSPLPTTFLSLPVEIRLQIYNDILTTSNIHSFRPQRKIGWNRPHADLTNPALLFESDAHISLKRLFHSKLTKGDHHLILETVLHHAKILVVDHADFTALLKIATSPSGSGATASSSSSQSPPSTSNQSRSLASVVRSHLRTIDFSDRMDEIICQPNDIVKLVKGLPGLRSVCLTSRHVQRYSGTVDEHIEFTRERAERELSLAMPTSVSGVSSTDRDTDTEPTRTPAETASELRRLTLRSPMTDGNRMMISPALFNRSLSLSLPTNTNLTVNKLSKPTATWVVVDLSMLIWQHFLYNGAPYRDHWRTIKMTTLLEIAGKKNVDVVMNLRNVEFDPVVVRRGVGESGSGVGGGRDRRRGKCEGGVFRGEMSSRDWMLRLRKVGGGRGSAGNGVGGGAEYCVRQRRAFDEIVGQDRCG